MHIKLFNNGFYTILQFRLQNYNKNCTYASVRVFFRKKIEFFLLFYARRWLWMLAYGRHLGV